MKSRLAVEALERRALLAYSTLPGSYAVNGAFVGVVSIVGDNNADSLVIAKDLATNLLTHAGDDNTGPGAGQFADQFDWDSTTPGSQHLLADSGTTVSFQIGAGPVTHNVTLGSPASPASGFAGTQFTNLAGALGATRTVTVDDSTGAVPAVGADAYSIDLGTGPDFILSGPGFRLNETASANGGLTLKGGVAANTFNLLSTFGGEPINLVGGPNSDTFNVRRLSGSVTVNGGGGADSVVVGNAGLLGSITGPLSISDTGGGLALTLDDSSDATGRTVGIGANSVTGLTSNAITYANLSSLIVKAGAGGDTVTVNATPAPVTLNTGAGDDTVNVRATTSPLTIDGQDGADTINVGNAGDAQGIQGTLTVSNTNGSTTLNVDDSADANARVVNVGSNVITGLTPAAITFSDVSHLTLTGGLGGNLFTIADPSSGDVTVNAGGGADVVNVLAISAPLLVDGQGGENTVAIGDAGSLQAILAGVAVSGDPGSTRLVVDDSADVVGRTPTLAAAGGLGSLSGIAPVVIQYTVDALDRLFVRGGDGDDALTIDFAGGNPVPVNSLGYTGGGGSNTLNLQGGVFTNEDYLAAGPGAGVIVLDASAITFTDLLPINDVVVVTNFTFTAPPGSSVLNLVDGPIFNGFQTAQFNGGAAAAFELMNFANKTNVTINGSPTATSVTINNPTAAAGLAALTLNTDTGGDQASVIATPAGVALSVNLAGGDDAASVVGAGLAPGTTPIVDGGTNFDTLNYDAGGVAIDVTAGGAPGAVLLARPGSGTLDARNFEQITISNALPVSPVVGPVQTVQGVEGASIIDAALATFTSAAPGAKAADFLATIVWGDGTTSAGAIAQDAGDPSVFYVTGTHTYGLQGSYVAEITIVSLGSSGTTIVNGVPVTVITPPGDPVTTTANVDVANAPLTVDVFAVTGTEGLAIPAGPIATFQDAGGAHPVGDYTATITIVDSNNNVVLSVPAASIVASGSVGSFLVNAPSFTLTRAGTYTVRVSVTDVTLPQPTTQTSTALAVIADAPLTAQVAPLSATQGEALVNVVVATFTDAGGPESVDRYEATIDWGDGTPRVGGVVVSDGATFRVLGTHTYQTLGSFTIGVVIHDHDGAATTAYGTVDVQASDVPLTLTGGLDPSSDTGESQTDGITNDATPTFTGTSQPGAIVRLVAAKADQPNVAIPIGSAVTDASGVWRITSPLLADGVYTVVASALGANGVSTATLVLPPVVIDTVGPTVASLQFSPLQGRLTAGFQDDLSGLNQRGLHDGSNFVFTKAQARPGRFLVTSLDVSPASGNAPQTVVVVVNGGRRLRGGRYALTVLARGVQDRAGNALDGEFYGYFPSGNRTPGGNFAARFDQVHRRISIPRPFTTTATPNVPPGVPGQPGVVATRTAALEAHDLALATIAGRRRRGGDA